jgi:LysM repeat protein
MSQSLIYLLLLGALVLPVLGALVLRVFAPRLSQRTGVLAASLLFGFAIVSALVLGRSDVGSLQIGKLTLLLPVLNPSAPPVLPVPPAPAEPPTPAPTVPEGTASSVPARPAASATGEAASATVTSVPSEAPTLTAVPLAPTEIPPSPTEVPPAPTEAPAVAQTYIVQEGDTLRGIAEQFNVSVADLLAANNLTPEDADALRPGQELIIP